MTPPAALRRAAGKNDPSGIRQDKILEYNMRRPTRSPCLATLCLQGNTATSTKDNAALVPLLEQVVRVLQQEPPA
jgi:hypothetical protein